MLVTGVLQPKKLPSFQERRFLGAISLTISFCLTMFQSWFCWIMFTSCSQAVNDRECPWLMDNRTDNPSEILFLFISLGMRISFGHSVFMSNIEKHTLSFIASFIYINMIKKNQINIFKRANTIVHNEANARKKHGPTLDAIDIGLDPFKLGMALSPGEEVCGCRYAKPIISIKCLWQWPYSPNYRQQCLSFERSVQWSRTALFSAYQGSGDAGKQTAEGLQRRWDWDWRRWHDKGP